MNNQNINPGFDDDYEDDDALNDNSADRDRTLKDELGETIDKEDLKYNPDDNSFEYDVRSDDPDYDHPDPYKTAKR